MRPSNLSSLFVVGGALALAACALPPKTTPEQSSGQEVTRLVEGYGYAGVFRFCDKLDRAVYFSDTAHGGGLVVIDKAPECLKGTK